MLQLQVRKTTGEVLGMGLFPTPPLDDDIHIVDVEEDYALQVEATMHTAGKKLLSEKQGLVLEPPDTLQEGPPPVQSTLLVQLNSIREEAGHDADKPLTWGDIEAAAQAAGLSSS
jgi:hypothetical protein